MRLRMGSEMESPMSLLFIIYPMIALSPLRVRLLLRLTSGALSGVRVAFINVAITILLRLTPGALSWVRVAFTNVAITILLRLTPGALLGALSGVLSGALSGAFIDVAITTTILRSIVSLVVAPVPLLDQLLLETDGMLRMQLTGRLVRKIRLGGVLRLLLGQVLHLIQMHRFSRVMDQDCQFMCLISTDKMLKFALLFLPCQSWKA